MADEEEIKIIPRIPLAPNRTSIPFKKRCFVLLPSIFGSYLILIVLITFLPISFSIKLIALVIGSFLLEDLHRSLKAREYGREDS